jgi:multiple sugar transport system permease protein
MTLVESIFSLHHIYYLNFAWGCLLRMKRQAVYFYLLPSLLFVIIIFLIPLIYATFTSFTKWSLLRPDLGIRFIGLRNYVNLFTDSFTWYSLKVTLLFVAGAVSIEIVLGLAFALALNTEFFGWKIVQSLYLMPFIIAPVVVGFIWKFILDNNFGLVPYIIKFMGLGKTVEHFPLLANPKTALLMLIIADIWEFTPVVMLILLAGLKSLPSEPYEAATIDGATPFKKFIYITVPLLRPSILVAAVLRTLTCLQVFDLIYIMTGGGPGRLTETLSFFAYSQAFISYDIGLSSAANMFILFIAMIFTIIYMRVIGVEVE